MTIDGQSVRVDLYDTSGSSNDMAMKKCHRCPVVLLLYSVSDRASFDHIANIMVALSNHFYEGHVVIVGNKVDLVRTVSTVEGRQAAERFGARFAEMSVKTGHGVQAVIESAVRLHPPTMVRTFSRTPVRGGCC
jgi:translation elongation factor EF-4